MRPLMDVLSGLRPGRVRGVIYAARPWSESSPALVHDPWSVVGPPAELEPLLEADLAHEYVKAWRSWQRHRPGRHESAAALVTFAMGSATSGEGGVVPVPTLRITTGSGRVYEDSSEDLLYQLLLELEGGDEESLVLQRVSTHRPGGELHVAKRGDYVLTQWQVGEGRSRIHRTTLATMPATLGVASDWAFAWQDVATGVPRR